MRSFGDGAASHTHHSIAEQSDDALHSVWHALKPPLPFGAAVWTRSLPVCLRGPLGWSGAAAAEAGQAVGGMHVGSLAQSCHWTHETQ